MRTKQRFSSLKIRDRKAELKREASAPLTLAQFEREVLALLVSYSGMPADQLPFDRRLDLNRMETIRTVNSAITHCLAEKCGYRGVVLCHPQHDDTIRRIVGRAYNAYACGGGVR